MNETLSKKRKMSEISYNNVNWRQLFLKYDEDQSGEIDTKEFTFLVKDLLALRDSNEHVSLEEAISTAKSIAEHSSFTQQGLELEAISLSALQHVAENGAFDGEHFMPEDFMILSGDMDTDAIPLMRRESSETLMQEQKLRPIVRLALQHCKLKTQEKLLQDKSAQLSAMTASSPHEEQECAICYDRFAVGEMYGGSKIPKTCACDIFLCLSCLTASSRSQILEKQRPTCPHMMSSLPPRRCQVPIDQSLIAQLFKNVCPLCDTASSSVVPLLSVGCAHDIYHSFCAKCLFDNVHAKLSTRDVVQCPRNAECRGELDESAIRNILSHVPIPATLAVDIPVQNLDTDNAANPFCPNGHKTESVPQHEHAQKCQDRSIDPVSIRCNLCDKRDLGSYDYAYYSCETCNHDICHECVPMAVIMKETPEDKYDADLVIEKWYTQRMSRLVSSYR